MNDIVPGHSDPFDATSRRLAAIERFLAPYGALEITSDMTAIGARKLEVLGKIGAKSTLPNSGGGPFAAYVASLTEGEEKFAIGTGTIVKNVQTGESIEPDGSGSTHRIYSDTKAWIECAIASNLTLSSAVIKTGTTWPPDNGATFASDIQTHAYVHIGSVKDGPKVDGAAGFDFTLTRDGKTKNYHFDQKIKTHLYMAILPMDGKAAVFPLPFSG